MHSKEKKRGYSFYLENVYPSAKQYINTCVLCGQIGYSPVIEQEEFCSIGMDFIIHDELIRTLPRLELDNKGRCSICAQIQDR